MHPTRTDKDKLNNLLSVLKREDDRVAKLIDRLSVIYKENVNKRRGLVDGIGSVAKSLFGTMDAEDERRINEQLMLLQNNQNVLNHVTRNQLKVLNSTIAHIGNLEKTMEHNNKILYNLDARIYNGTLLAMQREEINEFYTLISTMLTELQQDVQNIYDFFSFAANGVIHPKLIPLEQIFSELRDSIPHLPTGMYFPFRLDGSEWPLVEKMTSISACYVNNVIYTIMSFPLIAYSKYKLIKVIPLPVPIQGNLLAFAEVNQHLFAVNTESSTYIAFTEEQLNQCIKVQNQYLCDPHNPVYSINSHALCEVRIYANAKENTCNTRYIRSNQTVWIALDNANAWLYSVVKEQEITIQCKNHQEIRTILKRIGKVSLKSDCKMITADMTVKTLTSTSGASIQAYLPQYNITLANKELASGTTGFIEPVKLKKIIQNPRMLMELSNKLEGLESELNENEFLKPIFIYPVATGTLVFVIIISVLIGIIIKSKCKGNRLPTVLRN